MGFKHMSTAMAMLGKNIPQDTVIQLTYSLF